MTDRMETWKKIAEAAQGMLDAADQVEMSDLDDTYVEQIAAIRKLGQDIRSAAHDYLRPDLKEQPK